MQAFPLVLCLLGAATPARLPAQAPQSASRGAARQPAEAYLQFLLGRRLEAEGDTAGAIAAHRRAADLDPESAEVRAELAGLYARQDQPREALQWAEAALAIDAGSEEAHRVLGLIYSALSDRPEMARRLGMGEGTAESFAGQAARHLEQADSDTRVDATLHFALGRAYVAQRAYDKAIPVLRHLLQEEPGASDAALLLAEALGRTGGVAEARKTLEEALAEQPDFLRARLQLAELDERQGLWTAAADEYGRALRASPGSVDITRRRAIALLRGGNPGEARDLLRGLAGGPKPDVSDLYWLFQAERDLDDLDAAEATARRLMAQAPDDVRGPYALAQILDRRRAYRAIVELLEPVVARYRADPQRARSLGLLLTPLGFAYQDLREYDRAIRTFEELQALEPADAAAAVYVVQAQVVAGRLDEAVATAGKARAQFSGDLRLVELEAEALRRLGRIDQAVILVREAMRGRDEASLAITLSELYASARRFDEAVAALAESRTKHPEDDALLFQIGAVYERAGRDAEAERTFREVLAKDPLHAQALNSLGYMLADRGRSLDEAVALVTRALVRDPGNASYLDSLGWAYVKLGRLDLAEPPLRQAAAELVTTSVVQDHFGDLLFKLKRFDEAIAAWQRALAGDGEWIERAAIEGKIEDARRRAKRR